nr:hypothetical protein [Fodinicola feengrottensis]
MTISLEAPTKSGNQPKFARDVVVIGGCGHVGLPLAIALADRGANVGIYDVNARSVRDVNGGQMPFDESGAPDVLRRVLAADRLKASVDPAMISSAEHVVVVIGTPVDRHLNPDQAAIGDALAACADHFRDGQLIVLRSTVYPGVTASVEKMVAGLGIELDVAFCPERIAEGRAMTELFDLPQIVSSRTARGVETGRPAFPPVDGQRGRDDARGSRAGQTFHQCLAICQVRHREPALHDGQRPWAGLRTDPGWPDRRVPAGGGHARARFSRRGRVFSRTRCSSPRTTTTTISRSGTPRWRSTRGCLSISSTGSSVASICRR